MFRLFQLTDGYEEPRRRKRETLEGREDVDVPGIR